MFLDIPKAYYDNIRKAAPTMAVKITEDIDMLEKLQILVDYDDKSVIYLEVICCNSLPNL